MKKGTHTQTEVGKIMAISGSILFMLCDIWFHIFIEA